MEKGKELRLVVLGSRQVGKSAITVRCLTGRFITEYASGEDAVYTHKMPLAGKIFSVQILDSCGKNTTMQAWADGVIVVYSIASRTSFKEARNILRQHREVSQRNAPVALVANKNDLTHLKKISSSEGQQLAEAMGCMFFEISAARDIEEIFRIFQDVCRLIVGQRNADEKRESTPNIVRRIFRALSAGHNENISNGDSPRNGYNGLHPHFENGVSNDRGQRPKDKDINNNRHNRHSDIFTEHVGEHPHLRHSIHRQSFPHSSNTPTNVHNTDSDEAQQSSGISSPDCKRNRRTKQRRRFKNRSETI